MGPGGGGMGRPPGAAGPRGGIPGGRPGGMPAGRPPAGGAGRVVGTGLIGARGAWGAVGRPLEITRDSPPVAGAVGAGATSSCAAAGATTSG